MMMISIFLLALLAAAATADTHMLDASTKAAKQLLESSRQLEDGDGVDQAFISHHSIMFDSCYNITSWSEDGFRNMGLVRYQLCPTKYIHSGKCFSRRVGEYLVDLNTFVSSYYGYKTELARATCEQMLENCGCGGNDDDCANTCYQDYPNFDWSLCNDDDGDEEDRGTCQALDFNNDDDNNRRRLDDNGGFYIGPYCGAGGHDIYMTLYTDETCSYEMGGASDYYAAVTGVTMPYSALSSKTLVEREWLSCAEIDDADEDGNNNNGDGDEEGRVNQMCEETYERAAKCETNMTNLAYPDVSGCTYITQLEGRTTSNAYQLAGGSSSGGEASWAATFFAFACLVCFGTVYAFVHITKRRKTKDASKAAPLVETEMVSA